MSEKKETPCQMAVNKIREHMFSQSACDKSKFCKGINDGLGSAIEILESLLSKEREAIESAHAQGIIDKIEANTFDKWPRKSSAYFNDTFKTQDDE